MHISRQLGFTLGLVAVLAAACCIGYLCHRNSRMLVNQDSLKVIASDDFPRRLSCQIHVGKEPLPCFHTDGEHGRITDATVYVSLKSSVSLLRHDGENGKFTMCFSTLDSKGKLVMLYDVNCDGIWDIRCQVEESSIHLYDEWLDVDQVCGQLTSAPSAVRGKTWYDFQPGNGRWQSRDE